MPVERTTGIEPASSAWEADILPMNYVRMKKFLYYYTTGSRNCKEIFLPPLVRPWPAVRQHATDGQSLHILLVLLKQNEKKIYR